MWRWIPSSAVPAISAVRVQNTEFPQPCATAGRYFDRLAAIHFKDVFVKDESIGLDRWWERLRFCELGGGNRPGMIDWQGTARLLKEKNYTKWVLVEHDTHLREPLDDLKISITELKAIME